MRFLKTCLATTALVPLLTQPLWANPLNGSVVAGEATISGTGTPDVTITQHTDRAAINWESFDIAKGERTRFIQPSASSVILNRVIGGNASQIYGTLEANGTVYLVNPDGILFGPSAVVDTGSFLGTTFDITNSDFMAGIDRFAPTGRPATSVINEGTITANTGGFAALVAPGVRNDGLLTARLGQVGMSAVGSGFSLDLRGDELISFAVSDLIAEEVVDVKTGNKLSSLVENKGKISAGGGTVALTAATARKVVDSVINTSGVIEANSVSTKGGKIILGAATRSTKAEAAPTQIVKVSGKISAAGKNSGEKGGTVQITGEAIGLEAASVDTTGAAGGGKILVGGDYKGGDRTANPLAPYEDYLIPTSSYLLVDQASTLDASATTRGDGGKVILWGDYATHFSGEILARGGAEAGDGGFVEVSSPYDLQFLGNVNTTAANGLGGQLLLDPHSVIIGDIPSTNPNLSGGINEFSNSLIPNLFGPNTTAYLPAERVEQMLLTNSYVWIFLTTSSASYGRTGAVYIESDIVAPANSSYLEILSYSDFTMDVYLNATVDFSNSAGFFGIGLAGTTPANAIYAGANGKIIANQNNVNLSARTVGTSSSKIPVFVVPDDDATQATLEECVHYAVCSDTGTKVNVLDLYRNDPDAFRANVFVNVALRSDQAFTTPPPSVDPGNPPVVDEGLVVGETLIPLTQLINIGLEYGLTREQVEEFYARNRQITYYGGNEIVQNLAENLSASFSELKKNDPRMYRLLSAYPAVAGFLSNGFKMANNVVEIFSFQMSEEEVVGLQMVAQMKPGQLIGATAAKLFLASSLIYTKPFQGIGVTIDVAGDLTGNEFLKQWGDEVARLHDMFEDGRADLNKKIDEAVYR